MAGGNEETMSRCAGGAITSTRQISVHAHTQTEIERERKSRQEGKSEAMLRVMTLKLFVTHTFE